ncbi:MCE family protein [Nocardioides sp. KC13]|uniref:MCE family protein n=1 Tax=Nocardioides turkmenicus TaxID=2711220 RepID=A0A6M1QYJ9_9ACTN|nr:MCE family protein [Nocardioides sp. KC13]NGN92770.1 MCE family protein [Nocardioides sp. KC13]
MNKFVIPIIIGALVLGVGAWALVRDTGEKTLVAHFPRTVSLYEGSDLRVLGVAVGKVTSVEPNGTDVKVTMEYEEDVDLPADGKAVIISPSIVGDRYVQVTPAYDGGEKMADGAVLSTDKTSVPVELDQIYSSVDDLVVALGPDGANKNGALTDLLQQTAKNLGGQGEKINSTVGDLGKLTETLDNRDEQFFDSAEQLEGFIGTLAENDQTVRDFAQALAEVSSMLEGEREELATSLRNLSVALTKVTQFVRENKSILREDIQGLNRVSKVLVKQRKALDESLRTAPLALTNLGHAYNPETGTLDTQANMSMVIDEITQNPAAFLCSLVDQATNGSSAEICSQIRQMPGLNRSAAIGPGTGSSYGVPYDMSLGGLVEVTE